MLKVNQLVGFWYSPSDLDFLGGAALILGEAAGMGIDFTYHSDITKQVKIRGTGSYYGSAYGKLTYTSPATKLCRQADGVWRYANHNVALQSENFTTSWSAQNVSVSGNATTAPDGVSSTAETITASAGSALHDVYSTIIALADNANYALSCYMKKGTHRYVFLGFGGELASLSAVFDLDGGGSTATQTGTTGSSVILSTSMTAVGNGWFRCGIIGSTSSGSDNRIIVGPAPAATGNTFGAYGQITFNPAGTETIHVWGAQLKRYPVNDAGGFTAATGYLATTTTAAFDLPFEWDISGNSLGILVEEQRANLNHRSQEFDNVYYLKTRTTVSANVTTAPDGTTTADKLVEDSSAATNHYFHTAGAISISNATVYTYSIFVKAAGRTWVAIQGDLAGGLLGNPTYFNLSTGVIATTGAGVTASIQDAGNGWYQCKCTATSTGTTASPGFFIAEADNDITFSGNGTDGIYLWGAQLEPGSFPTSPIHTVAGSITRAPDKLSLPTASFPYSSATSTVVEYLRRTESQGIVYLWELFNAAGDRTLVYTLGSIRMFNNAAGINDSDTVFGPISVANLDIKIGTAIAVNDLVSCIDAGTVTVDVGGNAMPAAATTLYFGSNPADVTNTLNGYIRQFTYLPRRVTNLELQTRTNDLGASVLLLGEDEAMSFDFTYPTVAKQLRIKDNTTPANMFNGAPRAKLTYTSPSVKLTRQSDGVYRYNNHNLVLQSQAFATTWGLAAVTVTTNTNTAPDGTSTADTISDAGGSSAAVTQGVTLVTGVVYEASVYIKKDATGKATRWPVFAPIEGGSLTFTVALDTATGETAYIGGGTALASGATDAGTYWRVYVRWVTTSTAYTIEIYPAFGSGNLVSGNASAATTGSIVAWGAQLKRLPVQDAGGYTYATGYMATTTTALYDPPYEWDVAGVPQGILIEEQRTNSTQRSQEYSNAYYTKAQVSITADQTTAPDGTLTADLWTDDGSNNMHSVFPPGITTTAASWTFSVFAKQGTGRYLSVSLPRTDGVTLVGATFDLQTGTVTATRNVTLAAPTASIINAGNGWWRCILTATMTAGQDYHALLSSASNGTPTTTNYDRETHTSSFTYYVWGHQFELGAFVTSPIHTTAGTMTRVVDNIRLAASLFPISTTPTSTLIVSGISYWDRTAYAVELFKDTNNRVVLGFDTALTKPWFADGLGTWDMDLGTYTAGTVYKMAGAFQAADTVGVINGGSIVPDTTVTIPTTATELIVGGYGGNDNNRTNGHIRQITYLKRRASNLELQQKTQP